MMRSALAIMLLVAGALGMADARNEAPMNYFRIHVVDEQTGRGVPLVELRTTGNASYYTDSHGLIAFHEPGLMDTDVFFHVSSHGYEYPADRFDIRGVRLHPKAGESATVRLKRVNLAERLYRVTGQGIYRDTVLLGEAAPVPRPVINGLVMGQDSVQTAIYRGRLRWFWGDTGRPAYPLGNFRTSSATSLLPEQGGLPPSVGVDLAYFVDEAGFSRPMVPLPEEGMYWIDGLMVLPDEHGRERLVARFMRVRRLGETLEKGLLVYDDAAEAFERLAPLEMDGALYPAGHPVRHEVDGQAYFYFPAPYPVVRVRAAWQAVVDVGEYEAFTCLEPGARFEGVRTRLDRDAQGRLVWAWKRDTAPLREQEQRELIEAGVMADDEAWHDLRDVQTGRPVQAHTSSVSWNAHLRRWMMILCEVGGESSWLGEVWLAQADHPHGPWRQARKIVTHDDYSFYNVRHHPYFDEENGRIVYFEGTYTAMFSGVRHITPRYDYNQVMYRLDLSALEHPGD